MHQVSEIRNAVLWLVVLFTMIGAGCDSKDIHESDQTTRTEATETPFSADSLGHTFNVVLEDGVPTALNSGGPKYDTPIFSFV
ncbi:hypothetical protein ACFL41_02425, partial [Gemmatimonadota bacterium]